jgi:hypothetical protein
MTDETIFAESFTLCNGMFINSAESIEYETFQVPYEKRLCQASLENDFAQFTIVPNDSNCDVFLRLDMSDNGLQFGTTYWLLRKNAHAKLKVDDNKDKTN